MAKERDGVRQQVRITPDPDLDPADSEPVRTGVNGHSEFGSDDLRESLFSETEDGVFAAPGDGAVAEHASPDHPGHLDGERPGVVGGYYSGNDAHAGNAAYGEDAAHAGNAAHSGTDSGVDEARGAPDELLDDGLSDDRLLDDRLLDDRLLDDRDDLLGVYGDGDDGVFADGDAFDGDGPPGRGAAGSPVAPAGSRRQTRSEARRLQRASKQRRRGRLVLLLGLVLLVGVGAGGWYVVRPALVNAFGAGDYSGSGTGQVLVQIRPGDGAAAIASTLHTDGVVRSERAFILAAASNDDSKTIQPGFYQVHKQMKASLALTLLLDPAARVSSTVTIPEGTTVKNVVAKLTPALKLTAADFASVTADPSTLGLPAAYAPSGGKLTSLEGFLFPDTYTFDPGTSASDAISTMVNEFISTDRTSHFSDAAKAVGLTPYQALIVASMVEGEAKFDADRPKVARVILNRMAANEALGIDATSIYGAIVAGRDPAALTYTEDDPYNTRNKVGLPPTPIGNPGAASLKAAVNPAAGDWVHYVNGDAEGHLTFTDEAGFEAARLACQQNNWGCD